MYKAGCRQHRCVITHSRGQSAIQVLVASKLHDTLDGLSFLVSVMAQLVGTND